MIDLLYLLPSGSPAIALHLSGFLVSSKNGPQPQPFHHIFPFIFFPFQFRGQLSALLKKTVSKKHGDRYNFKLHRPHSETHGWKCSMCFNSHFKQNCQIFYRLIWFRKWLEIFRSGENKELFEMFSDSSVISILLTHFGSY